MPCCIGYVNNDLESLQKLPDGPDKKEAMRTFGIVCDKIVKTIEVIQSVLKPNSP